MDGTWLLLSGLFSLIGLAVSLYGRRQQLLAPTIIGLVLMGYPYFVSSYLGLVGVGVGLLVMLVVGTRMENGL
jgi:hypothetical protein